MRCLSMHVLLFLVFFSLSTQQSDADPIDIDGDGIIGQLELIDLALHWKGPASGVRVIGGPTWTSNSWSGSIHIGNGGAIGWYPNDSGQSFGIGQSNGGLYFFRTSSEPGNTEHSARYDLTINDFGDLYVARDMFVTGEVGIGTENPSYQLHVVGYNGAIRGDATYGNGLWGDSEFAYGVYGESTGNVGIYGYSAAAASAGVWGIGPYIGVQGITLNTSTDSSRQAVRGDNHNSATGWAGYFHGKLQSSQKVLASGAVIQVDHPLDPANKYLNQSMVESPDMMNIHNGNVELGKDGEADVSLPEWFMAYNKDFRYQLTPVGGAGPNLHVSQEVTDGKFRIAGGQPGLKVSWQVTGIRQDAFAKANPLEVEQDKSDDEKGKYLHPELHGKDKSEGIPVLTGASIETTEPPGKK